MDEIFFDIDFLDDVVKVTPPDGYELIFPIKNLICFGEDGSRFFISCFYPDEV